MFRRRKTVQIPATHRKTMTSRHPELGANFTMLGRRQRSRVGLLALLATVAATPSKAVTSTSAATADAVSIELAIFDRLELSRPMRERVVAEADAILFELGARPVWQNGSPQFKIFTPGNEIQIILSKSRPERWGLPANTMGAVVPTAERSRRLVFVFAAEVARGVGLPTPSELPDRAGDERRLAMALGRVIAHELVHAIAPEHPHADDGIMLGRHPASSLLDPDLRVDSSCAAAFRAELGRLNSELPASQPDLWTGGGE